MNVETSCLCVVFVGKETSPYQMGHPWPWCMYIWQKELVGIIYYIRLLPKWSYRQPLSLLMLANAVMQPYLVPSWCLDIHSRKRWWTISNVSALSTVSWDIPVNEWQNSDNVGLIAGLTNEWNTSTMDLSFDDTSTAGNSMISWGYPGGFFSSQVASKSIFGK